MKNKYLYLSIITVLSICVSCFFILKVKINKHKVNSPIVQRIIEWRGPLNVSKIQVLSGHEYDLSLIDGRRILASLDVFTAPESKEKVINFLNRCSHPRVILRQQDGGGVWLVSLYVTAKNALNQDVEIDLSTWLREKNLVYNNKVKHARN